MGQANHGGLPKAGFARSPVTALWKGTGRDRSAVSSKHLSGQTFLSRGQYPATRSRWELTPGQLFRASFRCQERLLAPQGRRNALERAPVISSRCDLESCQEPHSASSWSPVLSGKQASAPASVQRPGRAGGHPVLSRHLKRWQGFTVSEDSTGAAWFPEGTVNSRDGILAPSVPSGEGAECKTAGELWGKSGPAPSLCGPGKSPHLSGPQLPRAEQEGTF